MTYVLAWFAIGFVCAVMSYGYNTEKVFEYKINEYLQRSGKPRSFVDGVTYGWYRMFSCVLITLYGAIGIISFYSIRSAYFKTL